MICKTLSTANLPKRTVCSLVSYNNCLYLFGGLSKYHQASNELYQFHDNKWKLIHTKNAPARLFHTAIVYNHEMIIFGGTDLFEWYSEIWSLNFHSLEWKMVKTKNDPPPQSIYTATLYKDKMFIVSSINDVKCFALDLISLKWEELVGRDVPDTPPGRKCFYYDGKLYVISFQRGVGKQCVSLDLKSMRWTEVFLRDKRVFLNDFHITVFGEMAYVFGGGDHKYCKLYEMKLSTRAPLFTEVRVSMPVNIIEPIEFAVFGGSLVVYGETSTDVQGKLVEFVLEDRKLQKQIKMRLEENDFIDVLF